MTVAVETTVAAPLATVWRADTTPADIVQWNAASGAWHTTHSEVDLREGGAFRSRMEAKDGSRGFDFAGVYTRIVPHRLLEYTFDGRHARVKFDRNALTAYTVVRAASHAAAAKLFEGHPHFTLFPGEGVEVMECLPIPGVSGHDPTRSARLRRLARRHRAGARRREQGRRARLPRPLRLVPVDRRE